MFRLRFLLPVVFAVALCGQTNQNAADPQHLIDQAVRALQNSKWQAPVSNAFFAPGAVNVLDTDGQCSVPLLQAEIPKDVNFTIVRTPPPQEFHDAMPVAKVLPTCPLKSK